MYECLVCVLCEYINILFYDSLLLLWCIIVGSYLCVFSLCLYFMGLQEDLTSEKRGGIFTPMAEDTSQDPGTGGSWVGLLGWGWTRLADWPFHIHEFIYWFHSNLLQFCWHPTGELYRSHQSMWDSPEAWHVQSRHGFVYIGSQKWSDQYRQMCHRQCIITSCSSLSKWEPKGYRRRYGEGQGSLRPPYPYWYSWSAGAYELWEIGAKSSFGFCFVVDVTLWGSFAQTILYVHIW